MRVIFFFMSYLISLFTIASTLTVPAPFEVLKVDGKAYSADFFASTQQIYLSSGQHVIELRYKELFDDFDHDDHTIIKSEPFVVVFTMSTEALYLIAQKNKDESSAKAFAENPVINLVDSNEVNIPSRVMLLDQFEHLQMLSVSEIDLGKKEINSNLQASNSATEHSNAQEPVNKHSRALDMLMYWWQQASVQEQHAFIEHMKTNKESL